MRTSKKEAYLEIRERVPVWVKSGSNTVLGSDLTQTAGGLIWTRLAGYSIKITVFGTFMLQKRLFLWSEYRNSNPRPLGPKIASGRISNSTQHIWCDCVQIQRFSELPCPTCPYGAEALWVTVWVRQSCHSAKVGVFGTFMAVSSRNIVP